MIARSWVAHAACKDVDPLVFFPEPLGPGRPLDFARAKNICGPCPVRAECAEHGIRHEAEGVWGGLTPAESKLPSASDGTSPWSSRT